jgi:biopolymer transport protein ExbD
MQFVPHKRRQAPTVIIVSLIDVLLVVLIFLMVTTTFKQMPSVKLALPESKQQKAGSTENSLIVTISKQGPIYLQTSPVTMETLQKKLADAVHANAETTLSIRADTEAPWGQIVKVMDAARAANIKVANAFTRTAQGP